jgi:hypothetical protein
MTDKNKMYEIAWDYDNDIHIMATEKTSGLSAKVLQEMEDNVKKMYNEGTHEYPPSKD